MSVDGLRRRWRGFWWGQTDPRLLAALRIGFALVAIWTHISWWPEVDTLLDANGFVRTVVAPMEGRGFSLFSMPWATGTTAMVLHGLSLAPLLALLLGVGGRWVSVLAWVVVVGWYHRIAGASSGGDRLLRFALLYLACGPCTAVWSVDALLARRRGQSAPVQVSVLSVRLIQAQWAGMYLLSGLDKWSGTTWRHGTALHYALSNRTFARLDHLLDPLLASPTMAVVLQVSTLVVLGWELAFAPAMFGRRSRGPALLIGVLVHLGIGLTMSVGPFTLVTLVGYIAFLDRPGGLGGRLGLVRRPNEAAPVQSFPVSDEPLAATESPSFQESP